MDFQPSKYSGPVSDLYMEQLNDSQRDAVSHFEGPLLVLAGAGSGKTRVLTTRIANLINQHGVSPDRILAVTFTNKAAGEMRNRITSMLGEDPEGMWVSTFHALGARMLRRHAQRLGWNNTFSIFDAEQSLKLIKKATENVGLDTRRWNPKAIRAHVSEAKNQLVSPQQFAKNSENTLDIFNRHVAKVYPVYQRFLKNQNAFDFDDLLVKSVDLLEANPDLLDRYQDHFSFVLVDEYQDTNSVQFRFVEMLASKHKNLMVVGDDDQSIYGWRGANIRNILDFEKAFPGTHVVFLEENYRSTDVILSAANAVIAENVQRKEKKLRTDRIGGECITLLTSASETDEARWICDQIEVRVANMSNLTYSKITILYRTNAQSRALEDVFRRRGIPYQIVGGVRFYERREIQDVLSYLRIISNPLDTSAFERIVNYPRRGIGSTTKDRMISWAESHDIGLLEMASRANEVPEIPTAGAKNLKSFALLIQKYSAMASHMSVGELLESLVYDLEILEHLNNEGSDGKDRVENVRELIAGALEYNVELIKGLGEDDLDHFTELDLFLQQVALVSDLDRHDSDADAVNMMTIHNSKGLEFPLVFISGLEEGLFPLGRAYDDPAELEEERRLFYVAITRAEDKLFLTHARQRRRAGDIMYGRLSSFVGSIPGDIIEEVGTSLVKREEGHLSRTTKRDRYSPISDSYLPSEDVYSDQELNQDLPNFVNGERVVHDKFGSGIIGEVSGFGRDLKVTIHFDSVGSKKLLARYAKLHPDYD